MTILKNKIDKIIVIWIMKLLNIKCWATKLIEFYKKFNELGTQ